MTPGNIKQAITLNLKNLLGYRTKRKLIIISVDDYGNVRLDSREARKKMDDAGLKILSSFDSMDTLETTEDLEMLYDTLRSVRDKNGNHAVFTPFALPANINFEKMAEEDYQQYHYELLPETFDKLGKAYEGAWQLWKEGMKEKLMVPQFHGREHLNLKVFNEKLATRDHEVITSLKNRSYTSISGTGYSTISYTAAFEFWKYEENEQLKEIITDGLNAFERVFGYRAVHFNAPGGRENPAIHEALLKAGVKYIDTPFIKSEHVGEGKYKKILNYTGKRNHLGQLYIVRNVVFEPGSDRGVSWVDYAMKQIEAAFRWNRPANISTHRINFCGHIDPKNREAGLQSLRSLLQKIAGRWPDVEFIAASDLGDIISER